MNVTTTTHLVWDLMVWQAKWFKFNSNGIWNKLLFHVQEALGSNLAYKPAILTGFSLFYSVTPGKFQDSTPNEGKTTSFHILLNLLFTLLPYHLTTYNQVVLKTLVNKP